MALKLGEVLVAEGLLTPAQVEQALESQRQQGGALGARLLALGLIDEDLLSCALSKMHGVPWVSRADLLSAPPEIVALLPPEFSRRRRALPFAVEGERLLLALQDPADRRAVDEAAFLTGFVITPHIAPEVVIQAALSHHYHFPDFAGRADGRDRRAVGDAGPRTPVNLREVARRLADAKDRDEVLALTAEQLARLLQRGMVFALRGGAAVLAEAWGVEVRPDHPVALPAAARSVITPALERRVAFGPVEPTPANRDFYAEFGGRTPASVLVAPVIVRGRTVLALYADDTEGVAAAPDFELVRKLSSLVACALELLILRSKMLRESST